MPSFKNKHNIGLVLIDYLQLMSGTSDNRNFNREQEISNISRNLKALAKELNIPIVALSQLSREVEKRKEGNKMPQLSDLRESGAIEQDADMVMFLYRPEYYDITANEMGESNKGETHIRIAKHRNGSLDTIKLKALLHIQKFVEDETGSDGFGLPTEAEAGT
jgi:replicative DNA helicase